MVKEKRERLNRELRRRMGLLKTSPKRVSLEAGLSETAVKDILSGKSENPKHDTLEKIAKRLACTVQDLFGDNRYKATADYAQPDVVSISELDVHVAAGQSSSDDAGGLMAAHESSVITGVHTYPAESFREAYGINPVRIRIIPVRGTSMEPELWSGQRVMVDVEDREPSPPGIFVVWDGLGLVIKYIEVVANSDPLRVRISSAHQAFKPYERNLGEAYINGRVVGVWKRM